MIGCKVKVISSGQQYPWFPEMALKMGYTQDKNISPIKEGDEGIVFAREEHLHPADNTIILGIEFPQGKFMVGESGVQIIEYPKKRVRCIDNKLLKRMGASSELSKLLTIGDIYSVKEEVMIDSSKRYILVELPEYRVFVERFEDVIEGEESKLKSISDLFQEKVRELQGISSEIMVRPLQAGDKVHYSRFSMKENGIIKSVVNGVEAFVVYKCGDDWENYRNFTGVLTALKYLKRDWYDIHDERNIVEGSERQQSI